MNQFARQRCMTVAIASTLAGATGCDLLRNFLVPAVPAAKPAAIGLHTIADGFVAPVAMAVPPDGSGRMFIVDQTGQIHVLDASGVRRPTPFLDLTGRMIGISAVDERGLLGLAFHPGYAANGRFYVFYSAPKDPDDPAEFDSEVRVSEFRVSASDADQADPDSERVLLDINKPQGNHNGGQLAFGPDGMLYVGVGDGGAAHDSGVGHNAAIGNGQDKSTLLGKILRIDVDGGPPYGVPPDNPFVNDPAARPEIFAFGFRNPWRFSFDSGGARRLFAGDVGQNLFEEIDLVVSGGNYGWRIREGAHCFDPQNPATPPADCPAVGAGGEPLIDPIIEQPQREGGRTIGRAVIGGFVYRGSAVPGLGGCYVFAQWSTGHLAGDGSMFVADESATGAWTTRELSVDGATNGRIGRFILAIGQDAAGELYVLSSANLGPTGTTGRVDRIVAAP